MRRLRRSQYYEYRSPQVINVLFFSKEKKQKQMRLVMYSIKPLLSILALKKGYIQNLNKQPFGQERDAYLKISIVLGGRLFKGGGGHSIEFLYGR